jgi:hypothetical protein
MGLQGVIFFFSFAISYDVFLLASFSFFLSLSMIKHFTLSLSLFVMLQQFVLVSSPLICALQLFTRQLAVSMILTVAVLHASFPFDIN